MTGDAALLVNPYNINEIKTAMEALLTDDTLRNKIDRKGESEGQPVFLEEYSTADEGDI